MRSVERGVTMCNNGTNISPPPVTLHTTLHTLQCAFPRATLWDVTLISGGKCQYFDVVRNFSPWGNSSPQWGKILSNVFCNCIIYSFIYLKFLPVFLIKQTFPAASFLVSSFILHCLMSLPQLSSGGRLCKSCLVFAQLRREDFAENCENVDWEDWENIAAYWAAGGR